MTDRVEALLSKVEAGEDLPWPKFAQALGLHPDDRCVHAHRASKGSLDAALALHNAVLPGFTWMVEQEAYDNKYSAWVRGDVAPGHSTFQHDDPARAWLCAILKALIAEQEEEGA